MARSLALLVLCAALISRVPAPAAEVLLPNERTAYAAREPLELAVAGLAEGEAVEVRLVPQDPALAQPYVFDLTGDGTTVTANLPPYALAPARYQVHLGDAPTALEIAIVTGVADSTMLVSQVAPIEQLREGGANFAMTTAFGFGRLEHDGAATRDPRSKRSPGLEAFDRHVEHDLPWLIYQYWTGVNFFRPWGPNKSWTDEDMVEAMRLLSFHAAQRLRRYGGGVLWVGTLDEPAVAGGRTPAGVAAPGFPMWQDEPWYRARGFDFTDDVASLHDEQWLRYLALRTDMLREAQSQAREDLRQVWPQVAFSTDFFRQEALPDGCDPLNQAVNDFPTVHAFVDRGWGKLGALAGVHLEKAAAPLSKVAHAMNGQLYGEAVPQPQQRHAYHLMMNALLAAGVRSNWWLNTTGMTPQDLALVNEPARRIGPLFAEMRLTTPDTAVLWSFTEQAMRQKALGREVSALRPGESLTQEVPASALPSLPGIEGRPAVIARHAYTVGSDYKEAVLIAHQALARAGYPAHVIHEHNLPRDLRRYKTLVVAAQTHPLAAEAAGAIEDFVAGGGRVVADRSTTIELPAAVRVEADLSGHYFMWNAMWRHAEDGVLAPREASLVKTTWFMDEMARSAAPAFKAAMRQTPAAPVMTTYSVHLAAERHAAGEGALLMVMNGHEELPPRAEQETHRLYNLAPHAATFTLHGIPQGAAVYRIEGLDWRNVARVEDPAAPQTASFDPGEMKLYLVAPSPPRGLEVAARARDGALEVSASLRGPAMPWPLEVTVIAPDGRARLTAFRATDEDGSYRETLPLGRNAVPGRWSVQVRSPVADLLAETAVEVATPTAAAVEVLSDAARVFDEEVIRRFLADRPPLTVVVGGEAQRPAAEALAEGLRSAGIEARIAAEADVLRKARYPRVWDPFIAVHRPSGNLSLPHGADVLREVTLRTRDNGAVSASDHGGNDLCDGWRQPGTLATVAEPGFIDLEHERFYDSGCRIYIDGDARLLPADATPSEVKATEDVRRRWSRPWTRLASYHGTTNLVPQLPEAYSIDEHLVLLGDSTNGELVAALQASDLLLQVADAKYPGPGKALVAFAWSPFAVERNVIFVGASDDAGLRAGTQRLLQLLSPHTAGGAGLPEDPAAVAPR